MKQKKNTVKNTPHRPTEGAITDLPSQADPRGGISAHTGGVNATLADGSVRFLTDSVSIQTLPSDTKKKL